MVRARHLDYTAQPLSLEDFKQAFPTVADTLEADRERRERRQQAPAQRADASPDLFPAKLHKVVQRQAGEITGSGRHELLKWAARACLDNDLTQADAETVMLEARDLVPDRPSGPVPDREVLDIVDWTYQTLAPGEPWRIGESSQAPESSYGRMRVPSPSSTRESNARKLAKGVPDPQARASIFDRLRGKP
jgi:hypothetical protein